MLTNDKKHIYLNCDHHEEGKKSRESREYTPTEVVNGTKSPDGGVDTSRYV